MYFIPITISFSPYRTFVGPVGGLRSQLPADANHLIPYFNSRMVCINESAWVGNISNMVQMQNSIRVIDFSIVDQELRGFSDAIRIGRYAYFSPFKFNMKTYSGKFVRLYLGTKDIADVIDNYKIMAPRGMHDLIDVIDLSTHDERLKGFTGLFNGK